jgi:hypothetical protein
MILESFVFLLIGFLKFLLILKNTFLLLKNIYFPYAKTKILGKRLLFNIFKQNQGIKLNSSESFIQELVPNNQISTENNHINLNCISQQTNCVEIKRKINNSTLEFLDEKIIFNKRLESNLGNRTDMNQVSLPINSTFFFQ